MPVLRYFVFVGAALMALLFVVGWGLPASPVVEAANPGTDLSTIRIHSDRNWPERRAHDRSRADSDRERCVGCCRAPAGSRCLGQDDGPRRLRPVDAGRSEKA
jgi:hypothetical protein